MRYACKSLEQKMIHLPQALLLSRAQLFERQLALTWG